MKNAIKTFISPILAAILLFSFANVSFAQQDTTTLVTATKKSNSIAAPKSFDKVIVTGNARVILVQAKKEDVRIYDYADRQNIRITQKGYKLYIDAKEGEPATIYVHVKDLQRIDASQNSRVKTQGNFNLSVLQILLQDSAKADVTATVNSMYTNIRQNSSLKLAGSCNEHTLIKSEVVTLKMDDFAALKTTVSTIADTKKTASLTK